MLTGWLAEKLVLVPGMLFGQPETAFPPPQTRFVRSSQRACGPRAGARVMRRRAPARGASGPALGSSTFVIPYPLALRVVPPALD